MLMGAELSFISAVIQIKEARTFSCMPRHTPLPTVSATHARGPDLKAFSPRNAQMNAGCGIKIE